MEDYLKLFENNWSGIKSFSSADYLPNYEVDENEDYWNVEIAVPGLGSEEVKVKVKNSAIMVEVPKSKFTAHRYFRWKFPFKLKPKSVTSSIEDGVLTVTVVKPKDSEFSVKID